jgi:putative FmdB family regulatory protein
MPIFEYRCKECGHSFETLVRGRERARCPSCESFKLEKLLSTFAAVSGTARVSEGSGPGACGSCGDPRGPGACARN